MSRDSRSPVGEEMPEEPGFPADRKTYGDALAMPQEDDLAGDGHMWSGKTSLPQDGPEADAEAGAPGHLPTHPTGPLPF